MIVMTMIMRTTMDICRNDDDADSSNCLSLMLFTATSDIIIITAATTITIVVVNHSYRHDHDHCHESGQYMSCTRLRDALDSCRLVRSPALEKASAGDAYPNGHKHTHIRSLFLFHLCVILKNQPFSSRPESIPARPLDGFCNHAFIQIASL